MALDSIFRWAVEALLLFPRTPTRSTDILVHGMHGDGPHHDNSLQVVIATEFRHFADVEDEMAEESEDDGTSWDPY